MRCYAEIDRAAFSAAALISPCKLSVDGVCADVCSSFSMASAALVFSSSAALPLSFSWAHFSADTSLSGAGVVM